jgi:hypothetical protein
MRARQTTWLQRYRRAERSRARNKYETAMTRLAVRPHRAPLLAPADTGSTPSQRTVAWGDEITGAIHRRPAQRKPSHRAPATCSAALTDENSRIRIDATRRRRSPRRMVAIALALGPLAQPRDQHRNTEYQQRDSGDPAGRAPGQPQTEDERGEQEREQRREPNYVMGNTIWLAIEILRRPEATFVTNRCEVLLCCGHAERPAGYVPRLRSTFLGDDDQSLVGAWPQIGHRAQS